MPSVRCPPAHTRRGGTSSPADSAATVAADAGSPSSHSSRTVRSLPPGAVPMPDRGDVARAHHSAQDAGKPTVGQPAALRTTA